MFKVKICGLTSAENAREVVEAGADAIGLNFFPNSQRYVDPLAAATIVHDLPPVQRVGVFVNASAEHMLQTMDEVGLDWLQLHGDESPELVAQLPRGKVIRAIRWSTQPIAELCQWQACGIAALLVDAYAATDYGGTGKCVDWSAAAELRAQLETPLVLAGGLRANNVGEAIRVVRPAAVDTASGVESAPGRKSTEQVSQFVRAARAALDETAAS